jgi:hypothetical protein
MKAEHLRPTIMSPARRVLTRRVLADIDDEWVTEELVHVMLTCRRAANRRLWLERREAEPAPFQRIQGMSRLRVRARYSA